MRKKLLALVMCATMILGTAVTASAYTEDELKAAQTVIDQHAKFEAEFNEESKKTPTFVTTYKKVNTAEDVNYKYGYQNGAAVKVNKDNEILTKTSGKAYNLTSADLGTIKQNFGATAAVNVGDCLSLVDAAGTKNYYYVKAVTPATAATQPVLAANQYFVTAQKRTDVADITAGDVIVTVEKYTPANTAIYVEDKTRNNGVAVDDFMIDIDGYISLKTGSKADSFYATFVDGYYAVVTKSDKSKRALANAMVEGTISKNAVAIDVQLYKSIPTHNDYYDALNSVQYDNEKLVAVDFSRNEESANVKADWLSRTNLKKADGVAVFVLDKNVPTYTKYFERLGSVYKVAEVKDGKFTPDYLVSGTYIFDEVAVAADNAGQSDADTKPATDNTSSPKTGDVAPIAALAVVMMGAFGAMVVASKKRA